jgi:hypothetical protein
LKHEGEEHKKLKHEREEEENEKLNAALKFARKRQPY